MLTTRPAWTSHLHRPPRRLLSRLVHSHSRPPPPPTHPRPPSRPPISQRLESRVSELQRHIDSLSLRVRQLSSGRRRDGTRLLLSTFVAGAVVLFYWEEVRFFTLSLTRGMNVGLAVAMSIVDYKVLFYRIERLEKDEEGRKERHRLFTTTHTRSAVRIREALKRNGGIYIKLGQHLSSVQLVPEEWRWAMRELQDQCFPTPVDEIDALFQSDVGAPLSSFFSNFDPIPLGVASLAQVHKAVERGTGREVAVKIMHPNLEEFAKVDMKTTTVMLKFVKGIFPDFEFTWLGEEMEQNLPLEMDFRHEAANAMRCRADFSGMQKTSLVIPEVIWAKKRVMLMEFIKGGRIDDLAYLKQNSIDRNEVAKELTRIFSQMIYLNGFFHADPHGGNLLIRPAKRGSRSPHNFEIVLLDHGLYFDLPEDLRLNYAHLWLSLISPSSPKVTEERKHYAKLVGNITDEMYPVFESAITGRSSSVNAEGSSLIRAGGLDEAEARRMRHAVVEGGLIGSIFKLLRGVPRRLLMVLKVNDLTRHLDLSL
ncbi:ABC1-domain-containing protein [Atractiella rhizophila]|nr:ABC1-domain-containing protein [Atractiella rhizophila]